MVEKKKIYVHFERPSYVGGKSELLKVQMEILYLKKLIKSLVLTRAKKVHYRQMLVETITDLKNRMNSLDLLMPKDDEFAEIKSMRKPQEKVVSKKLKEIQSEKKSEVVVKHDEIEEELIRIKEKLASLNSA